MTGVARYDQFALTGFGLGVPTLESVSAEFSKSPTYDTIRQLDPAIFAAIREAWRTALVKGTTPAELSEATAGQFDRLIEKYGVSASDEAAIELARVSLDQLEALETRTPGDCHAIIASGYGGRRLQIRETLPEELKARESEDIVKLLRSAAEKPQPAPTPNQAEPLLRRIGSALRGKFGDKISLFSARYVSGGDQKTVCEMTVAYCQALRFAITVTYFLEADHAARRGIEGSR